MFRDESTKVAKEGGLKAKSDLYYVIIGKSSLKHKAILRDLNKSRENSNIQRYKWNNSKKYDLLHIKIVTFF